MGIPSAPVGTQRKSIAPTVAPVITAGAYSAHDAVGGKLTFPGAANAGAQTGSVRAVVLTDLAKQSVEMDLILFNADFTHTVDNAAFDVADADISKVIGAIKIPAANYAAFNDSSAATVQCDLPFQLPEGSTTIYGQLVTRGTPTYASDADLTVRIVVDLD